MSKGCSVFTGGVLLFMCVGNTRLYKINAVYRRLFINTNSEPLKYEYSIKSLLCEILWGDTAGISRETTTRKILRNTDILLGRRRATAGAHVDRKPIELSAHRQLSSPSNNQFIGETRIKSCILTIVSTNNLINDKQYNSSN